MRRVAVVVLLLLLAPAVAGRAIGDVLVEDWTAVPLGTHGIPDGWTGETWGKAAAFDLTVVEDGGRRALRLVSRNDRSTISKQLHRVDLRDTPILEWSWKVNTLPLGGDARRRETTDDAAQVYVVWPRFPALLRSRIIGYIWDTSAPAGATLPSRKAPTVTFVVVRSGPADLGRWLTERRDVRADYRRIYGAEPPPPAAVSLSIDSDDTHTSAESLVGPLRFTPGG